MTFYDHLVVQTAQARDRMRACPLVTRALAGEVSLAEYRLFLEQAYHHVKHTVPLLMACGARLPERLAWLRTAIVRYIGEEDGHETWILDDLAAIGGDPNAVRGGLPLTATELMVAYAYDTIHRGNPAGFFGMVYVLEGTSVALAHAVAGALQRHLRLPDQALRYLTSHGSVDQGHVRFLETLLNRLESEEDQAAVLHAAQVFFRLYREMFGAIGAYCLSC
ncbi:MAG: iron-containing redox enzyme family protein [Betaproteobacteria bacterium]|nr:iron-containing redox enzyme family protein [Betaproteobacteria bacterium]